MVDNDYQQQQQKSISWQFFKTYGVISYGSSWRKDVVNQCLEFEGAYTSSMKSEEHLAPLVMPGFCPFCILIMCFMDTGCFIVHLLLLLTKVVFKGDTSHSCGPDILH